MYHNARQAKDLVPLFSLGRMVIRCLREKLRNTANDQLIDTLIYVLTLSWRGGGVRYGTTPNRVIYLSRSFALMLISLPSERSIELSYRSREGSLDIGNRHRLTTVTTIAVALGMTHSAEVL
uniref:Uncharacterized protein n=1 Tax=Anopheles coluzzii TaxID=1518534 RepID=A0A8W7P239_ANOCL